MELFRSVAVVLGLSILLWGSFSYAQCTKDTDCKGDRICRSGACEDPVPAVPAYPPAVGQPVAPGIAPPEAVAPAVVGPPQPYPGMPLFPDANAAQPVHVGAVPVSVGAQEPAESSWFSGYAEVAGLVSLHSWLGDSKENAGYGVYAAGHWAPNPLFHLGAFFHFYEAHGDNDSYGRILGHPEWGYGQNVSDTPHLGTGVSLKIGGRPLDGLWIGGAMDLGVHMAFGNENKVGVHCFPRFEIDGLVAQSGKFRLALFGSFGPLLAPGIGDYVNGDTASLVALQMLAGFIVGG